MGNSTSTEQLENETTLGIGTLSFPTWPNLSGTMGEYPTTPSTENRKTVFGMVSNPEHRKELHR